jgi:type II secretory pathway pseudopilin PulG
MKIKINRKGFTLVEILLVVGFIAIAGISIYMAYDKVNTTNKALTESKNVNLLKAGIKNLYGGSQSYTGVTNIVLNDSRSTPDSMRALPYVALDNNIINMWGGAVSVSTVILGGGGINNGFQIKYTKVPGDVCAKLATSLTTNIEQITVAGVLVKAYGTANLDVPLLATNCATDTGTGVTMLFDSI